MTYLCNIEGKRDSKNIKLKSSFLRSLYETMSVLMLLDAAAFYCGFHRLSYIEYKIFSS